MATQKQQQNNRTSNKRITFEGTTRTISEWADHLNVDRKMLEKRLGKYGWTVKRALTTPRLYRNQITVAGVTGTKTELMKHFGVNRTTVDYRLAQGWPIEEAFTKQGRTAK